MKALLPCKPDRATRELPLGAGSVPVDMAGCETGGAVFAVAHAKAPSPEQAGDWLRAWRAATRGQLANRPVTESDTPARLDAEGVHVLWFIQRRPDGGASIYQATVSGAPSSPEAVTAFFEGFAFDNRKATTAPQ